MSPKLGEVLAKQGDATSIAGELTTTTSLVGSPKYMAPERRSNR